MCGEDTCLNITLPALSLRYFRDHLESRVGFLYQGCFLVWFEPRVAWSDARSPHWPLTRWRLIHDNTLLRPRRLSRSLLSAPGTSTCYVPLVCISAPYSIQEGLQLLKEPPHDLIGVSVQCS